MSHAEYRKRADKPRAADVAVTAEGLRERSRTVAACSVFLKTRALTGAVLGSIVYCAGVRRCQPQVAPPAPVPTFLPPGHTKLWYSAAAATPASGRFSFRLGQRANRHRRIRSGQTFPTWKRRAKRLVFANPTAIGTALAWKASGIKGDDRYGSL